MSEYVGSTTYNSFQHLLEMDYFNESVEPQFWRDSNINSIMRNIDNTENDVSEENSVDNQQTMKVMTMMSRNS